MNTGIAEKQTGYAGTIDASNKHLFSPAMQEAFEFFEQWGDKPINPEKHAEAFIFAFKWSWKEKISEKKQENPAAPFKEIAVAMIEDVPAEWSSEEMVRMGWQDGKHVHYAVFHFDIIGDKVWVQQNRTDLPIGYELMDLGIAESDWVYAYLPASLRGASA